MDEREQREHESESADETKFEQARDDERSERERLVERIRHDDDETAAGKS